jgi:acyl-coenzyme A thioesterase PaaI-like protein
VRGPVIGEHHPGQPIFEIHHESGRTHGRVNFGVTYEGPPGCVHGGYVAFFFDQILGQHNVWSRIPAMTGTLTVRYRRATPLLTDLEFEVRSRRIGERKVLTSGHLAAGSEVVCEAEGLFVVPRDAAWADPPA